MIDNYEKTILKYDTNFEIEIVKILLLYSEHAKKWSTKREMLVRAYEPYIHKVDLKSERITLTLMLKEQSCAFLFIIFYIRVVVSWRSRVCYPHLWIIIGPIIVFKLLILETRLKSGVKLIKVAFGECVCVCVSERERERERERVGISISTEKRRMNNVIMRKRTNRASFNREERCFRECHNLSHTRGLLKRENLFTCHQNANGSAHVHIKLALY